MIDNDHDRLIRIEQKLDTLLEEDRDKELRLRVLEADRAQARGAVKMAAAVGGGVGTALGTAAAILFRKI